MNIEMSARDWRKVWEQLYNMGNINMAGRIAHDVGHAWNNDDWDGLFTLDFDASGAQAIRNAAGDAGLDVNW